MILSRNVALPLLTFAVGVLFMAPEIACHKWTVGAEEKTFWKSNVNYTTWGEGKHFYNGDWLYFVYDRYQMDVVEVNKTDYGNCTYSHPLHNWTTGAGRDVVPLNETRHYYFTTTKGACFSGTKLAINVLNPPPPPSPPPEGSADIRNCPYVGQIIVPAALAIAAAWDSFLLFW